MKFLLNLLSDASSVVNSTNSSVQGTWLERNGIWLIFGAVVVLMIVFNVRQRKKQQQEVEKKMKSLKEHVKEKLIIQIWERNMNLSLI